jgi:hypothetical protein
MYSSMFVGVVFRIAAAPFRAKYTAARLPPAVVPRSIYMYRQTGEVVVLRYITTDQRIEMAWPCRVIQDTDELLALFIAAGSKYKAGPKVLGHHGRRASVPEILRESRRAVSPHGRRLRHAGPHARRRRDARASVELAR